MAGSEMILWAVGNLIKISIVYTPKFFLKRAYLYIILEV